MKMAECVASNDAHTFGLAVQNFKYVQNESFLINYLQVYGKK